MSERGDNYSSGYFGPPSFNIDIYRNAYMDYFQNPQYYQNLRHTDPHRYAEWYERFQYYERHQRSYAGQMTAANSTANANITATTVRESGRESVHSGRSSAKDADR